MISEDKRAGKPRRAPKLTEVRITAGPAGGGRVGIAITAANGAEAAIALNAEQVETLARQLLREAELARRWNAKPLAVVLS